MRTDDDRNDRMSQAGSTSSGQADLSQASEQSAARVAPAETGASEDPAETAEAQADRPAAAEDGEAQQTRPAEDGTASAPPSSGAAASSSSQPAGPQSDDRDTATVSADGEARAQARDGDENRDQDQDLVIRYDLQMSAQTGGEPQVDAGESQPVAGSTTAAAASSAAVADAGWTDLQSRMDSLSARMDDMTGRSNDEGGAWSSVAEAPNIDAVLDNFRDRASDPLDADEPESGLNAFRAQANEVLERWNSDDQVGDLLSQLRDGTDTPSEDDEPFDLPDFAEALALPSVLQDSGFSGATPPTDTWMSRLFEPDDTVDAPNLFLSANSAMANRADDLAAALNDDDSQDVMNLPSASSVTELGGGLTVWDGLDLGG